MLKEVNVKSEMAEAESIGESILSLEAAWETIKTPCELWFNLKNILKNIGIKNIAFFLYSNPSLQDSDISKLHIYKLIPDTLNPVTKLVQKEKDDIFDALQQLSSSTLNQPLELTPVSIKNLTLSHSAFGAFEQNTKAYIIPYFGPRYLNAFTVFDAQNEKEETLNESVSLLRALFSLVHDKFIEIYCNNSEKSPSISSREKQVLQMLIRGKTNIEIAKELGISTHIIGSYVNVMGMKLHTTNRTATAVKAVSLGLVRI
ncbi:MAG: LuxR C-terminal-related transcriptional regulator [Maricaulaceae bacterium]